MSLSGNSSCMTGHDTPPLPDRGSSGARLDAAAERAARRLADFLDPECEASLMVRDQPRMVLAVARALAQLRTPAAGAKGRGPGEDDEETIEFRDVVMASAAEEDWSAPREPDATRPHVPWSATLPGKDRLEQIELATAILWGPDWKTWGGYPPPWESTPETRPPVPEPGAPHESRPPPEGA